MTLALAHLKTHRVGLDEAFEESLVKFRVSKDLANEEDAEVAPSVHNNVRSLEDEEEMSMDPLNPTASDEQLSNTEKACAEKVRVVLITLQIS